jgi:hypothetical protein
MTSDLKSCGKCPFCNQTILLKAITKHLKNHLLEIEKKNDGKLRTRYIHVKVDADVMFLHLLVRSDQKLKIIDDFLRKIWLDCCDHLSEFRHRKYKIKMNDLVTDIFQPKIVIQHHYDFGDTTVVELRSEGSCNLPEKGNLILLSRNEPLKIMCRSCKKAPAVWICTTCIYETEGMYCEKCAEEHGSTCEDFNEYSKLPVVNSPRMGCCGYEGGMIDKERDGVYSALSKQLI